MDFFRKLERKYHRYAIPNLMYYIILLYGAGLVIWLYDPMIYFNYLCLNPEAIMHGQVWRLVTFLAFPPAFGGFRFTAAFMGVLALFVYYNLGQTLESIWGSFRFNVFFLSGVMAQILAAFIGYVVFGQFWLLTTGFLNSAIFLAFALYYPDAVFLLFFVLPVKAKWLAVAECAAYLYSFLTGGISTRVELVVSLINIIIFFAVTRDYRRFSSGRLFRRNTGFPQTKLPKRRPMPKMEAPVRTYHRCAVCGRTEHDGADLEFRYCSKCIGGMEYCQDHLYTHQHVTLTQKQN